MQACIRTKSAAGVFGLDAEEWRRILGSKIFEVKSATDLRRSIALLTRITYTNCNGDSESLEALLACRLIPLDKNPGMGPKGIGEIIRRIIGEALPDCARSDIINTNGNLQLCTGIISGCEIAVHVSVDMFEDEETWTHQIRSIL